MSRVSLSRGFQIAFFRLKTKKEFLQITGMISETKIMIFRYRLMIEQLIKYGKQNFDELKVSIFLSLYFFF